VVPLPPPVVDPTVGEADPSKGPQDLRASSPPPPRAAGTVRGAPTAASRESRPGEAGSGRGGPRLRRLTADIVVAARSPSLCRPGEKKPTRARPPPPSLGPASLGRARPLRRGQGGKLEEEGALTNGGAWVAAHVALGGGDPSDALLK
jgi:hypothetical protein